MIDLNEIEYKIFTVREVQHILLDAERMDRVLKDKDAAVEKEMNLETTIDMMFSTGLPARVVSLCTGLKVSEMADINPDDYADIQQAVGIHNPFFLKTFQELVKIGRKMKEKQGYMNST